MITCSTVAAAVSLHFYHPWHILTIINIGLDFTVLTASKPQCRSTSCFNQVRSNGRANRGFEFQQVKYQIELETVPLPPYLHKGYDFVFITIGYETLPVSQEGSTSEAPT